MADLQQCYNTGCGSKFNAKKNIEGELVIRK